jgi:hypothetical protein
MIGLYVLLGGVSALSALVLFVMKLTGYIKAGWLGVFVWVILLAAISWGSLSVAAQISAAC